MTQLLFILTDISYGKRQIIAQRITNK